MFFIFQKSAYFDSDPYVFIYVFVFRLILVLLEVYNVHRERAVWPKGLMLNLICFCTLFGLTCVQNNFVVIV